MRAADVEKDLRAVPPHTFTLPTSAWATSWDGRPTESITVGLRRVSAETRMQANAEAIARTDRVMPEHRRDPADPVWRRTFDIAFLHYLLGYALCNSQDVRRPLWDDQDGHLTLVERKPEKSWDTPLVSRRFTDEALLRCYDELEICERRAGVGARVAKDGELLRLGAILADGSLLATLRDVNTEETQAVENHLRVLLGQVLDLVERGRETPHPSG